eukprot:m.30679 g.30679  ORF g.30679 m.30679 type:complete len:482 (-) comp9313_c0_seq1:198-1643(-)
MASQTLPQTFPQDDLDAAGDSGSEDEQPPEEVWGRLLSLNAKYGTIELKNDVTRLGRNKECDMVFPDARISSTHCVIRREKPKHMESQLAEDEYVVFVLDFSANGTYVNGKRVGKEHKMALANDDRVELLKGKDTPSYVFRLENDAAKRSSETSLEDYKIIKPLGSGACGEVFLAHDIMSGRKYAIKAIHKKRYSSTGPSGADLLLEVDILRKLDHPNIIHVHDMHDSKDKLHIVLEFAQGGELFDRIISKRRFSNDMTRYVFLQLLDAVEYLHDQGVAHRDLKPENVLLSGPEEDAMIKVTDFGLAKLVGPQSFMQTMCGTPCYQAPEVIRAGMHGHHDLSAEGYGKAVDMWSLGVMLFIFLSGYPPFSDEYSEPLSKQILEGQYDFPTEHWKTVDPDGIDLIKKLLQIDPTQRLTVQQAKQHPFMNHADVRARVDLKQRQYRSRRLKAGDTQTPAIKRRATDYHPDGEVGAGETPAKRS